MQEDKNIENRGNQHSPQKEESMKDLLNKIPISDRKKWIIIGFVAVAVIGLGKTIFTISNDRHERTQVQDSIVRENLLRLTTGMKEVDQEFTTAKDSVVQLFEKVDSLHLKGE
jgi:hypothetical protein